MSVTKKIHTAISWRLKRFIVNNLIIDHYITKKRYLKSIKSNNKTKDGTLFYAPLGIFKESLSSVNYLSTLVKKPIFIKCFNKYKICVGVYYTSGLNPQKKDVMRGCVNCYKSQEEFNVKSKIFYNANKSALSVQNLENKLELYNGGLLEFKFENIKWGELTAYEFVLSTKSISFKNISDEHRLFWKNLILNSI